jgi:hypothetical protein
MRLTPEDYDQPQDYALRPRRRFRKTAPLFAAVLGLGFSGLVAAQMLGLEGRADDPAALKAPPRAAEVAAPVNAAPVLTPLRHSAQLLDPSYSLGATPAAFGRSVGLRAEFVSRQAQAHAQAEVLASIEVASIEENAEDAAITAAERETPLPAPRPAELSAATSSFPEPPPRPAGLVPPAPQQAKAPVTRVARAVAAQQAAATQPADNRGFFEKLFGGGSSSPSSGNQALAYAAPQDSVVSGKSVSPEAYTAVYDISARTVTLPNGTKLEAHSGLGDKMDDPRHVHVRMHGATPPHVYDLKEREALFHGVRAIRLTPVGGAGAIHGRAGLLAHTFMLGPSGQSNGCVSFRNYDAFLQAYLRGEVKRLAVVAGSSGSRWASR